MEQILSSLVRELPSLGGLALIVIVFLRHINKADERGQAMLERMAEQCHDAHDRIAEVSQQAIDRGTRAIDRNTQAIERNTERMGEMAGRLGALNGKVVSMLVALTLLAGGRADAQDNRAISDIGLCHPRYGYEGFISQFKHATKIRTHFLMKTFNPNGCPNAERLVREPRPLELHVSVLNGPGERNGRLQRYEYLSGISQSAADAQFRKGEGPAVDRFRAALRELRAIVGPARAGLELHVKPCLECNYSPAARSFLLAESKRQFPEAGLIDNPLNGSCVKRAGTLCEKHSNVSGYDVVDLDGTDYDRVKQWEWGKRNPRARRVAAWKACKNGFEKDTSPWLPPTQRRHFCGARDNQDLAYWVRPDALELAGRFNPRDLEGCTRYRVRDGDSKGFIWKLSDGRNHAAMLAPAEYAQFRELAIVKDGRVLDRGRFRALYKHDVGKQRRVYDFTRPPTALPNHIVIRAQGPTHTVCFALNKPQFRID